MVILLRLLSISTFLALSLLDRQPVYVNRASASQLESLPGIGPAKAAAIIAFRERFGPFTCPEDLLEVPGIGETTLAQIENLIVLDGWEEAFSDTSHWLPLADSIENPIVEVAVLDIGEGDAVLVRAPDGLTALVDAGPDDGGPVVPPVIIRLAMMGVEGVDIVMMTHPHDDHIGGMGEVVRDFGVSRAYDPCVRFQSPAYIDFLEAVEETGCGFAVLDSGVAVQLSDEVTIRCLDSGSDSSVDANLNEISAVMMVEAGAFSMLLPGDIEEEAEMRLAESARPVTAMVIPHHGSRTSDFPPLLRRLRPQIAVVSAGRNNPFGHPHSSVLERYETLGALVLRTDRRGSIFIRSDGRRICITSSM